MLSFAFANKENHAAPSNQCIPSANSLKPQEQLEKQKTSLMENLEEAASVSKTLFTNLLNSLTFAKVLSKVEELQKAFCENDSEKINHTHSMSVEQVSLSSETLNALQLPVVIVVGDENSGKSSTLERLAMVDVLPRNHQICTRQPIALLLRHNPKISAEKPFLRLTIPGVGYKDAAIFENITASEVNDLIYKQMLKIQQERKGILMDQEITVEVQSDGVPTIKLVDLPGLIAVQTFDSAEPNDLAELSEQCTRKYLDSESTGAVVCVIDATISNLRTSKAIRMIQESRKELQNHTIGVFAKADASLAANYEEEGHTSPLWRLESRLRNDAEDTVSLPFGFVALKNRNTRRVGGAFSLEEQREDEEKFFTGKLERPGDLKEKIGLDALIKKIDTLICMHLSASWVPGELQKLASQREVLQGKIWNLGIAPEEMSFAQLNEAVSVVFQEQFTFQKIDELCEEIAAHIPKIPAGSSYTSKVLTKNLAIKSFYNLIESGELVEHVETNLTNLVKESFDNSVCGDIKLNRFTQLRDELLCNLKICINEVGKNVNKRSAEKVLCGCNNMNYFLGIKDFLTETILLPIFFPRSTLCSRVVSDKASTDEEIREESFFSTQENELDPTIILEENDLDLGVLIDAKLFPFVVATLKKYSNEPPKECCADERLRYQREIDILDKVENTLDGLVPTELEGDV